MVASSALDAGGLDNILVFVFVSAKLLVFGGSSSSFFSL